MARLTQISTDISLETEGTWVPYLEDIELRIARSSNPEFQAWCRRALRPHRKRAGKIKEKEMRAITVEGWARFILKGWRNLQDELGKEIQYSWEKAVELLSRPDLKDMFDFVIKTSQSMSAFIQESIEEDAGN